MDEIKTVADGFQAQLGTVQQDIGALQTMVWHLLKQSSPHLCLYMSSEYCLMQASLPVNVSTMSDTSCVHLSMPNCMYLCARCLSQQIFYNQS